MSTADPNASANPQIFMSYSRSEMYYAEAVTNFLQNASFNIWFDLQQLEPGCKWKDDIGRGLEESDALILIASRIALASQYVELEWRHAMEKGRPIHIVVFEEVVFGEYTYVNSDGNTITFDTRPLLDYATTVVDGRGNFQKAMQPLVQSLKGEQKIIQKVPEPNRFGLTLKLPWEVAVVQGAMLLLVVILVRLVMTSFANNALTVMIVPGLLAPVVGRELWRFVTRKSFAGTRTTLLVATIINILFWFFYQGTAIAGIFSFTLPLALIFGFAYWLATMSLGVNRRAPRGEGTRRDVQTDTSILDYNFSILLRIIRMYANAPRFYKLLILFVVWLTTYALLVVINNNNFTDAVLIASFVPVGLLVFAGRSYSRRTHKLIEGAKRSFRVVYNVADRKIATTVDRIMAEAGHRSKTGLNGTPQADGESAVDFYVLIVSNYLQLNDFEALLKNSGRWIILVASSVENRAWHKLLQDFQWVDFRKQNWMQIKTIAAELQLTAYDRVSTSLSSRTTPQSFSQIIVPNNVQIFVFLILVVINILTAYFIPGFLNNTGTQESMDTQLILFAGFIIYLPVLLYSVDTVVYTIIRETSQTRINNLPFVMFLIPIYGLSSQGAQNMANPEGWEWAMVDPANPVHSSTFWLALMLVTSFATLNRITNLFMQEWAPQKTRTKNKADVVKVSGKTRRKLYLNALFVMFMVCVVTYSLTNGQYNFGAIIGQAMFTLP